MQDLLVSIVSKGNTFKANFSSDDRKRESGWSILNVGCGIEDLENPARGPGCLLDLSVQACKGTKGRPRC